MTEFTPHLGRVRAGQDNIQTWLKENLDMVFFLVWVLFSDILLAVVSIIVVIILVFQSVIIYLLAKKSSNSGVSMSVLLAEGWFQKHVFHLFSIWFSWFPFF